MIDDDTEIERDATPGALLHASAYVTRDAKPAADDSRTAFVASTRDEDRHGTVVRQDWKLAQYRKNPVILWMHDHDRGSIGKGSPHVVGGGDADRHLRIDVEWDMADPFAALRAGKYARGIENAGSVSFRPTRTTRRDRLAEDDPDYKALAKDDPWAMPPLRFDSPILIEFSGVSVPSNANALAIRSILDSARDVEDAARQVVAELVTRPTAAMILDALRNGEAAMRADIARELFGSLADDPELRGMLRGHLFPPARRDARSWLDQVMEKKQ